MSGNLRKEGEGNPSRGNSLCKGPETGGDRRHQGTAVAEHGCSAGREEGVEDTRADGDAQDPELPSCLTPLWSPPRTGQDLPESRSPAPTPSLWGQSSRDRVWQGQGLAGAGFGRGRGQCGRIFLHALGTREPQEAPALLRNDSHFLAQPSLSASSHQALSCLCTMSMLQIEKLRLGDWGLGAEMSQSRA